MQASRLADSNGSNFKAINPRNRIVAVLNATGRAIYFVSKSSTTVSEKNSDTVVDAK
jgi:hypothetical protein